MDRDCVLESIDLENIKWSHEELSLSDFVDKFPLPQIVRVQEGYYGPDEDSCLGADQILFLHALKHTDKVKARDRKKRELHIPFNCSQKVELRPSKLKEVFESVAELAKEFTSHRFPEFVRVVQGYDSDNVCINLGDKLKLLKVIADRLVVESVDGSGTVIQIPLSASAGFQPLTDGREFYLQEAVNQISLPFLFQFINPLNLDATGEASVFNSNLGVLKAENVYHDLTVICTTKEGAIRTVVSCPKKLQITVKAASGALIGDKEYMKFCKFFHDGVSLKRIENMECFNVFASRDTIREYVYDVQKSPTEVAIPSLSVNLPGVETEETSDGDESDHDYNYIPDEEITSWTFQKFNYEDFKTSFQPKEEEKPSQKLPRENVANGNEYLEVLPPEESPPLYKPKMPPPVKPKPVVKGQITYKHGPTVNAEQQNPKSEKEMPNSEDKKSKESETGVAKAENIPSTTNSSSTPAEVAVMTISQVSEFLSQHHLDEFIDVFEYNQIDGDMLLSLDMEMMESLGMNNFQQKKLLKLIQGWRPKC